MDHFIYSNLEDHEKGPRVLAYEFGLNVFSNETNSNFQNVSYMSDHFDNLFGKSGQLSKELINIRMQFTRPIKMPIIKYKTDEMFGDYRDKVVLWWNEKAITMAKFYESGEYNHKSPQLYLHGPPDSGKTYFIQYLTSKYIFR
jgi:hypothetical protein